MQIFTHESRAAQLPTQARATLKTSAQLRTHLIARKDTSSAAFPEHGHIKGAFREPSQAGAPGVRAPGILLHEARKAHQGGLHPTAPRKCACNAYAALRLCVFDRLFGGLTFEGGGNDGTRHGDPFLLLQNDWTSRAQKQHFSHSSFVFGIRVLCCY